MVRRVRGTRQKLVDAVQQLKTIQDQQALFAEQYKQVKEVLFGFLESEGEEDDNGHLRLDLPEPIEGIATLVKQKRVSVKLDEKELENLLRSKTVREGAKEVSLYDKCTKTVTVLDEDKVHAAIWEGRISEEEFEQCVERKVTWALAKEKS